MKKIQRIILAFMLGIVPIQSALADSIDCKLSDDSTKQNLWRVDLN